MGDPGRAETATPQKGGTPSRKTEKKEGVSLWPLVDRGLTTLTVGKGRQRPAAESEAKRGNRKKPVMGSPGRF